MTTKRARRVLVPATAVLILSAAAVAPGCAGCRGAAPLQLVPVDSAVTVVLPSLRGLVKNVRPLLDKLRSEVSIKMAVDHAKTALQNELGLDPENPDSFKAKGINPDGGLVLSVGADGRSTIVAFGALDPRALDKYLRELTAKAISSPRFLEKDQGGLPVTLVLPASSETPVMAWAVVKRQMVICLAAKEDRLGEFLATVAKQENNITANRTFVALRDKIGKHQAMVYLDGETTKRALAARAEEQLRTAPEWMKSYAKKEQEMQEKALAYLRGAALALRFAPDAVTVRAHLAMPADKVRAMQQLLQGTGGAAPFGKYIGPDALAVARFSLNLKTLTDHILAAMPPQAKRDYYGVVERFERENQLSLEKDIYQLIAGRYAWALFGPGSAQLGDLRSGPAMLQAVPMVGMIQVTEPARAAELLARLERFLTLAGAPVKTQLEGDRKTYTVDHEGKPIVGWTVLRDVVVVATGDRLPATVTLISKGGASVLDQIRSPRAKDVLKSKDGTLVYYSIRKTADALSSANLPTEVKLVMSGVLGALSKLDDLSLVLEADDEGGMVELLLRLR